MNKVRIANYIFQQGHVSKVDISYNLSLSMPTVLQKVKELIEAGIVEEIGEYQSNGGRKAKALSIVAEYCYAVGVDISANHVVLVIVDAKGAILQKDRQRKRFENSLQYDQELAAIIEGFIKQYIPDPAKIVGVGLSIPGIVDKEKETLIKSHALDVAGISLRNISQFLPYQVHFDNDANCAAYTELLSGNENFVYLSLNNTVGGAIFYQGQLIMGGHFKSGEFGHMIIVPGGKRCYCGKLGCVDCYCSALVLSAHAGGNLEKFFTELKNGNPKFVQTWKQYLEYLALTVSNLRVAFDFDVIIGGYVGGYLQEYTLELSELVMRQNMFDHDTTYLKFGKYKIEASAYGIAVHLIYDFFETLE